jgi:hypothetical protein
MCSSPKASSHVQANGGIRFEHAQAKGRRAPFMSDALGQGKRE